MSLDSRFPGGGGAKINGNKIDALCLENIRKGDFCAAVMPIFGITGSLTNAISTSYITGSATKGLIVKDMYKVVTNKGDRYLILYKESANYYAGLIEFTESGTILSSETIFHVNATLPHSNYVTVNRISQNSFVLTSAYSTTFYYSFLTVNSDGTITASSFASLAITGFQTSTSQCVQFENNKFLLLYFASYYVTGVVLTRSGNTFSVTSTPTSLISGTGAEHLRNAFLLKNSSVVFSFNQGTGTSGWDAYTPRICLVTISSSNVLSFISTIIVLKDSATTYTATDGNAMRLFPIDSSTFAYVAIQGSRNASQNPYYYNPFAFGGRVTVGSNNELTAIIPPAGSPLYVRIFGSYSIQQNYNEWIRVFNNRLWAASIDNSSGTRMTITSCGIDDNWNMVPDSLLISTGTSWETSDIFIHGHGLNMFLFRESRYTYKFTIEMLSSYTVKNVTKQAGEIPAIALQEGLTGNNIPIIHYVGG